MKNRPVTIACLIGLLALVNPGRLPAQTNTNAAVTVATNVVVEIPPLAATNTDVCSRRPNRARRR